MDSLYPVFLDLRGKRCLVVGGGTVASRKVETLLRCGARVAVISPALAPGLAELAGLGEIEYLQGEYDSRHLENAFLVIGAAGEETVNRRVAADCAARGIMVNIVDVPELCSFYVPSLVSRGPLSIAVSTAGQSPAFARLLREELERRYGEACGRFVAFLGELRPRVRAAVPDPHKRQALYLELAGPDFFHLFKSLPAGDLEREVDALIDRYREKE
jgi:precorrin-2 dehydrogenase/sirohydrochlorin ferrochelatase